ncbi:phosphoglycerate mutase family protein, partial [Rhodoferax sp. UBA5149]|uniref:phosphoglycerate mutase family protein n=1 Tax=Rhodoferax sp. UBA5149 TaxID=1947379 RepID=UPI0039C8C27A
MGASDVAGKGCADRGTPSAYSLRRYSLSRMNTAHICVARHGETDWNMRGILQGWFDVPINEQGRHQARQLAA